MFSELNQILVLLALLSKPLPNEEAIGEELKELFPGFYTGSIYQDLHSLFLFQQQIGQPALISTTSQGEIAITLAGVNFLNKHKFVQLVTSIGERMSLINKDKTAIHEDFVGSEDWRVRQSLAQLVEKGYLVPDEPGEEPDVSDELCTFPPDPLAEFRALL